MSTSRRRVDSNSTKFVKRWNYVRCLNLFRSWTWSCLPRHCWRYNRLETEFGSRRSRGGWNKVWSSADHQILTHGCSYSVEYLDICAEGLIKSTWRPAPPATAHEIEQDEELLSGGDIFHRRANNVEILVTTTNMLQENDYPGSDRCTEISRSLAMSDMEGRSRTKASSFLGQWYLQDCGGSMLFPDEIPWW